MAWLIGALINLVGQIIINLGQILMKLGHNIRLDLPVGDRPPVRRFRSFQLGIVLFAVGNAANFVSLGFAAQSLLAALGCIQFATNVLFGWLLLGEKVTQQVLVATVLIIGGCVALMVYGNHESPILTVPQLMALFLRPTYAVYLVTLALGAMVAYATYQYGRVACESQGISFQQLTGRWARLLPISYAAYAGMIGTQSVVFGKTLSLIVRASVHGDNQLYSPFTMAVVVLFVLAAAFWVTRLNKALRLFPGLIMVPTMQISWTMFNMLSGMVYFEEYKALTPLGAMMSLLGVAVIFYGMFLLTHVQKPKRRHSPDPSDASPQQQHRLLPSSTHPTAEESSPLLLLQHNGQQHQHQLHLAGVGGGARSGAIFGSSGGSATTAGLWSGANTAPLSLGATSSTAKSVAGGMVSRRDVPPRGISGVLGGNGGAGAGAAVGPLGQLHRFLEDATATCSQNATFTPLASYSTSDAIETLLTAGDDGLELVPLGVDLEAAVHSMSPLDHRQQQQQQHLSEAMGSPRGMIMGAEDPTIISASSPPGASSSSAAGRGDGVISPTAAEHWQQQPGSTMRRGAARQSDPS